MTLSAATILGQSGAGSDSNEGVFCIPQISSIIKASPLDCLLTYPGHLLGKSYSSAEMQAVYSIAPGDWATGHLLEKSYSSAEMQAVYSAILELVNSII